VLTRSIDKSKTLQARVVSGSMVLLSGSGLATGVNLAYNVAVARFLGPKGFGHATAVYTLLILISAVTLSFQIVSAKVVAQQDSPGHRSAAYRAFHLGAWGCGVFVALLLLLFEGQVAGYLKLPSPHLIALIAIGAAFYIPLGVRRGYIQGAYGFRRLATNLVVEGVVRLGGSLLLIYFGLGVTGVIAANSAAMAVAWLAIAPKLAVPTPGSLHSSRALRELLQAMTFFSGQVLINNYSIVQVKHYFLPIDAGLYAAVAMVGRVIFTLSSAVVNSMFPLVAGTSAEERKNHKVLATSLLMVLGVGSVLALGLRMTPSGVWAHLLGARFVTTGHVSLSYLFALFAITTVVYSLSVVIITYEMSYRIANTSWVQLAFSGALIAGIWRFHSSLEQVILVQLVLLAALLVIVGVPFLADAMRSRGIPLVAGEPPIQILRHISEDEVIAEFLKSDFDNAAYGDYRERLSSLVYAPNVDDPGEGAKRRALLFLRHRSLWKEIPAGTEWYEVQVRETGLARIRAFPRAQWRRIANGDFAIPAVVDRLRARQEPATTPFLSKIAALRSRLGQEDSMPGALVLIGRNELMPLTILDGNHRFVAAVLEGRLDRLRFVCGLSPKMTRCCWYRTSPTTLLRYAVNLLRNFYRTPEAELARLFASAPDPPLAEPIVPRPAEEA